MQGRGVLYDTDEHIWRLVDGRCPPASASGQAGCVHFLGSLGIHVVYASIYNCCHTYRF